MPDHATSTDAAVQAQLDRLWSLSPGADILGLDRITRLLARLGNPHRHLPPVFHVAGTNGKGSTCAFLRAALEAAGHAVHVYSSPHLVRFNERIRIAGRLIDDDALAALLAEVLDQADGIGASFFEITTAAAFLAFARAPASACIIEVGLGGRLDATNVITEPLVTGIAALGIDHQAFLGDTLTAIAGEKAGIAKPGVPLVTMAYPADLTAVIADVAARAGAPVIARNDGWTLGITNTTLRYVDPGFTLVADQPRMAGAHQSENYALAIAMLRRQARLSVPEAAMRAAAEWTHWPARLQRLSPGPLRDLLPSETALWLDGAHNPSAAAPIAEALRTAAPRGNAVAVIGMLANKDAEAVIALLAPALSAIVAVPVPGHAHHAPEALAALAARHGLASKTAADLPSALMRIATGPASEAVLIAGSLYLAGEALRANDESPT